MNHLSDYRNIFHPELQLLVLAGRFFLGLDTNGDLQRFVEKESLDWQRVERAARWQGVQPVLFHALNQLETQQAPATFLNRLKSRCSQIALYNLNNAREMVLQLRRFKEAGITAVPYKGNLLAHTVYGDFSLRESIDIDLLIHQSDLTKIKELLMETGYVPAHQLTPAQERRHLLHECEYNFDSFHENTRIHHLECHWLIIPPRFALPIGLKELEGQLTTVHFHQFAVPTLSPEMNFLVTAIHHGGKDQWSKIKNIMDIAAMLLAYDRSFDWEMLEKTAGNYGIMPLLINGLAIARTLFGIDLPPPLLDRTLRPPIQRLVSQQLQYIEQTPVDCSYFQEVKHAFLYHFRTRSSWKGKAQVIGGLLQWAGMKLSTSSISSQKVLDKFN